MWHDPQNLMKHILMFKESQAVDPTTEVNLSLHSQQDMTTTVM